MLDPGSPFLESGQLAANGLYRDVVPVAGLIAGIGRVSGRQVMVAANDATVKGGTYYPLSVKKHLRAQESAQTNRLPCLYLVDHLAENDDYALTILRDIVSHLGRNEGAKLDLKDPRPPYHVHEMIGRLVDGSEFHEFKAQYGAILVCGFAHIRGMPVAVLANNGVL